MVSIMETAQMGQRNIAAGRPANGRTREENRARFAPAAGAAPTDASAGGTTRPPVTGGAASPIAAPQPAAPASPAPTQAPAPSPMRAAMSGGGSRTTAGYRGTPASGAAPQASAGEPQFGSMQRYQDAAYDHAMRTIRPELEQQDRSFQQRLVNQGIDPNSAAGRNAASQIARQQADMKNSALFGAMQFGQNAQNQAFQQSLANAGLTQQNTFNLRGDRLARDQMFQQDSQFGRSLNQRESEFGRNRMDANTDRAFNMLRTALGMDQGIWNMNNQAGQQQFNARQAVAGSIPGWNPAMIDVNGAANAATNSQNAAFNAGMAMSPWNTAAQAGVAMAGNYPFG